MKATIKYDSSLTITARLFDPAVSQWYTGVGWSTTEANANLQTLTEKVLAETGYSRYSKEITSWPEGDYLVEYISTNEVIGEESLASLITPDNASIASILADTNELQADWVNGGRLDLILDSRASQVTVDDLPTSANVLTQIQTALNESFTDATSLTSNGLKDRLRVLAWLLRNKMTVNETTGDTTFYKDDGITEAFTVAGMFVSSAGATTRKRAI